MSFDKKRLHAEIVQKLEEELASLQKAAAAAYDGAVHEEAVSKSKYETHGLELSYLAGSHFERAAKLQRQLQSFKAQAVCTFTDSDPIAVGALVTLQEGETLEYIYLCHVGAGLQLTVDGMPIQIATPMAPLGVQLLESSVGDDITIPTKAGTKIRRLVSIC